MGKFTAWHVWREANFTQHLKHGGDVEIAWPVPAGEHTEGLKRVEAVLLSSR